LQQDEKLNILAQVDLHNHYQSNLDAIIGSKTNRNNETHNKKHCQCNDIKSNGGDFSDFEIGW